LDEVNKNGWTVVAISTYGVHSISRVIWLIDTGIRHAPVESEK